MWHGRQGKKRNTTTSATYLTPTKHKRNIDERCYDYRGLADATDFVVVMGYDLQSQIKGSCIAGANAGLPSVMKGVQEYLELGISPSKLVLGVPWYGRDYTCLHPQNLTVCPIRPIPFRGAACSDAGNISI
jgi:di-N-acetylchitobiase